MVPGLEKRASVTPEPRPLLRGRQGEGRGGGSRPCVLCPDFAEHFDILHLNGQGNMMAIIGLEAQRHREVSPTASWDSKPGLLIPIPGYALCFEHVPRAFGILPGSQGRTTAVCLARTQCSIKCHHPQRVS